MSKQHGPSSAPEPADDGPWLDPDEVGAQLLLFATPGLAGLDEALSTGGVAAVVADTRAMPEVDVQAAMKACRTHGVACLLRGDAAAARAARADGVHLDDPDRVAAARELMGDQALIGVSCALSRHAAMVAGEAGADYVMFGALADRPAADGELAETLAWWSELFVLPCVAAGRLDADLAEAFVAAGADLLAVRLSDGGVAALAGTLQPASPGEARS